MHEHGDVCPSMRMFVPVESFYCVVIVWQMYLNPRVQVCWIF